VGVFALPRMVMIAWPRQSPFTGGAVDRPIIAAPPDFRYHQTIASATAWRSVHPVHSLSYLRSPTNCRNRSFNWWAGRRSKHSSQRWSVRTAFARDWKRVWPAFSHPGR
jgi:hypothetical protein